MNLILFIVVVALFVALTPGILLSLPPKGSKIVVAVTHGIVFAVVLKLIYKQLCKFNLRLKGMSEGMADGEKEEKGKDNMSDIVEKFSQDELNKLEDLTKEDLIKLVKRYDTQLGFVQSAAIVNDPLRNR